MHAVPLLGHVPAARPTAFSGWWLPASRVEVCVRMAPRLAILSLVPILVCAVLFSTDFVIARHVYLIMASRGLGRQWMRCNTRRRLRWQASRIRRRRWLLLLLWRLSAPRWRPGRRGRRSRSSRGRVGERRAIRRRGRSAMVLGIISPRRVLPDGRRRGQSSRWPYTCRNAGIPMRPVV